MSTPPLPAGFVLESGSDAAGAPPLPPGFEIESPSFANVQSSATPPRSLEDRYAAAGIDPTAPDPTADMGLYGQYIAGVGRSLVTGYEGVKQLGTEIVRELAGDRTGLTDSENAVTRAADEQITAQQAAEAERRRLDAALMDRPAGRFGDLVGTVGQIVGPGMLARGTAIGRALLPTSIRGNAAQGAVVGALQPVAGEGERGRNVALGGGLGAAGAAVPQAVGAVGSRVLNALPAVTAQGQTRAAGNVLNQFAADPAALRSGATQPQVLVPGSLPTLAEATGDVGLAGLQRTLANMPEFGNQLAQRQTANNAARVAELERSFGGADPVAADAIRSTRDVMARRVLSPAREIPMQGLDKVTAGVTRLAEKHQASPAVRDAMAAVAAELPNIRTVGDAHAVRQYIGQLVGGQIEGRAGAKLAKRELMTVQSLLDREMRTTFPDWGKFLKEYKGASREADQVDVGATLLDTGRAVRGATNEPVLTPAGFSRAAGNLDRTVQRATGFNRARADRVLSPEQVKAVDTVRRDLERYARASTDGKAIGSNTVQNAIGGNTFQSAVGPVGAAAVEPISGIAMLGLNQMRKAYGEKVAGLVQEAMLDPARAAEILAVVPAGQRAEVVRAAAGLIPRVAGVVSPALAE